LHSSGEDWFGRRVDVSFDEELRRAFERKEPSPGFADRVLARISRTHPSAEETRRLMKGSSAFSVRWIAAVAASAVLVIGSSQYYAHRQAAVEAERVKQQLRVSLQIASEKLNDVQRKVWEHSQREF
jgi:anti-sigma-K factor RskA